MFDDQIDLILNAITSCAKIGLEIKVYWYDCDDGHWYRVVNFGKLIIDNDNFEARIANFVSSHKFAYLDLYAISSDEIAILPPNSGPVVVFKDENISENIYLQRINQL